MREAELTMNATLEQVAAATQQVRQWLPEWLAPDECDAIELGVAEALTNIVEHGYGGDTGETVVVRLLERPAGLEIEIEDRGRPIPPGMLEQADQTTFLYDPTDLGALPEGGMGLALIKAAFHDVSYRRKGGLNRLRLVRRL